MAVFICIPFSCSCYCIFIWQENHLLAAENLPPHLLRTQLTELISSKTSTIGQHEFYGVD